MLPNTRIRTYDRYKVNLATIADIVYSYGTPVAAADWTERQLLVPAYHSVTTSRHINYIAEQWNLEVVKQYALYLSTAFQITAEAVGTNTGPLRGVGFFLSLSLA